MDKELPGCLRLPTEPEHGGCGGGDCSHHFRSAWVYVRLGEVGDVVGFRSHGLRNSQGLDIVTGTRSEP